MNYYCFVLIDNGDDFYAEVRNSKNQVIASGLSREEVTDLPAAAKRLELSKFDPQAVIHVVDKPVITSAAVIETGEVKPVK